jgi:hypothetical protein
MTFGLHTHSHDNPRLIDGRAVYIAFPCSPGLTAAGAELMLSATRGKRAFLYARSDAPVPADVQRPATIADFPRATLQWLSDFATLINLAVLDSRRLSNSNDLAQVLLDLDADVDTEDHDFVVTIVVDNAADTGEFASICRPVAPCKFAIGPHEGPHEFKPWTAADFAALNKGGVSK